MHIVGGDFLTEADGAAGDGLRVYAGQLKLGSEPQLAFRISGDTSSANPAVITSDTVPLLVAGAAALIGAALLGLGWRRRRPSEVDSLVVELARLDEDHDQGRINHNLYHHRRRELKAKLAKRMALAE